MNQDLFS